jgi:hypothetical protein
MTEYKLYDKYVIYNNKPPKQSLKLTPFSHMIGSFYRHHKLISRGNALVSRGHVLVSRGNALVSCGHDLPILWQRLS